MSELRVRNLEDWVVEAFRSRARRNGRSMEAELRDVLKREAMRPKQEMAAELRALQEQLRAKYGTFSDSAELIREDRDARG